MQISLSATPFNCFVRFNFFPVLFPVHRLSGIPWSAAFNCRLGLDMNGMIPGSKRISRQTLGWLKWESPCTHAADYHDEQPRYPRLLPILSVQD